MLASLARGVLLTLLGLGVAGCGGPQIPEGLSGETLRTSGRGVLVVAARFLTTTVSTSCEMVQLTRAGDGRTADVMLTTHLPFEDPQVSGGVALDPGTYAVTLAICSRNNARYVIEPADARGMAKFSIGAGEVVDGGMLVIVDVFRPLFTPYVGKSNIFTFVRPRTGPPPAALNRELAAKMISRPMTAIDPPPPEALSAMCEEHRQHARTLWFSGGSGDSPLCQLIFQRPGTPAARK